MAEKNTSKKASSSGSAGQSQTKSKKLSVTLDIETHTLLQDYLKEYGYSKDEFVKKAITEKISRDKISSMIDNMMQF